MDIFRALLASLLLSHQQPEQQLTAVQHGQQQMHAVQHSDSAVIPATQSTIVVHIPPSDKPQTVQIPINFNPSLMVNNSSHASPTINAMAENKNNQTAQFENQTYVENRLKSIVNNQFLKEKSQSLAVWLQYNSPILAAAGSATAYVGLIGYLLRAYYAISHATWCNWKKHLSSKEISMLMANDAQKKELSQALMRDIFKHHMNPHEPTNTIKPLIDCMRMIDDEIALINRFIRIARILMITRFAYILPINAKKVTEAKKRKRRILLVKSLLVNWITTTNMNSIYAK